MKLWEKGYKPNTIVEAFTVGKDPELDLFLLPYDIEGSIAHAEVLFKADLLTAVQKNALLMELQNIRKLWEEDNFTILVEDEDGHTAIEKYLTEKLGDTGKMIHTGRSRNDQVLTALRLFQKDKLQAIKILVQDFSKDLSRFACQHADVAMPGYTHTRRAMPHTICK